MDFVFFWIPGCLQEFIDLFFQLDHLQLAADGHVPEAGQFIEFGFQLPFGFLQTTQVHQPGKNAGLAFVFGADKSR